MGDFVRTRDRMSGTTDTSNIKMGRGADSDFMGLKSADGFVTIINKRMGRSFVWVAECTKPGCMCQGTTFPHEYLVNGGVIKCASSGHDSATIEPVERRQDAASVQSQLRQDVQSVGQSVGARYDAARRQAEIKAFEEANNG